MLAQGDLPFWHQAWGLGCVRGGGSLDPLTRRGQKGGGPARPSKKDPVFDGAGWWGSAGPSVSLARKAICVLACMPEGTGAQSPWPSHASPLFSLHLALASPILSGSSDSAERPVLSI